MEVLSVRLWLDAASSLSRHLRVGPKLGEQNRIVIDS